VLSTVACCRPTAARSHVPVPDVALSDSSGMNSGWAEVTPAVAAGCREGASSHLRPTGGTGRIPGR
jgi:hypothetical protein